MTHRLENTIDVLMGAFFKGTLIHGEPCACALGQMLQTGNWINVLSGTHQMIHIKTMERYEEVRCPLECSPYSLNELQKIEYAFEGRSNRGGQHLPSLFQDNDPDGFQGLTNVFTALEEIDKSYFDNLESKVDVIEILETGNVPAEV